MATSKSTCVLRTFLPVHSILQDERRGFLGIYLDESALMTTFAIVVTNTTCSYFNGPHCLLGYRCSFHFVALVLPDIYTVTNTAASPTFILSNIFVVVMVKRSPLAQLLRCAYSTLCGIKTSDTSRLTATTAASSFPRSALSFASIATGVNKFVNPSSRSQLRFERDSYPDSVKSFHPEF